MSEYNIHLKWRRETEDFDYKTYDRTHTVYFYGGPKIEVSSAPDLYRNPQFHTPEELFVASVSSCYMLTFLAIAAKKKYIIDEYIDCATCVLTEVESKRQSISEVILRPVVSFHKGSKPKESVGQKIFQTAHEVCFITNSIKATVSIIPQCKEGDA